MKRQKTGKVRLLGTKWKKLKPDSVQLKQALQWKDTKILRKLIKLLWYEIYLGTFLKKKKAQGYAHLSCFSLRKNVRTF